MRAGHGFGSGVEGVGGVVIVKSVEISEKKWMVVMEGRG